jgi:hypothetical protein
MTDKKDTEDNIIIGPWPTQDISNDAEAEDWIKRKYKRALDKKNTQLKMQEKILKVDTITEKVMIQLIHTLGENGYQIGNQDFILDVGFLSEMVKASLFRQEKLPHVLQGLVDSLMTPEKSQNEEGVDMHYSRFDSALLGDLVNIANDVKERESQEENEVLFEPDTEFVADDIEDISDWQKKDKDDTEKNDD